jgi:putative hydrolase of the HAD superfamily
MAPGDARAKPDDAPAIDAAVFDLGGVVLDIAMANVPVRWAELAGLDAAALTDRLMTDTHYRRLERGEMSLGEYHQHICRLLGVTLTFEQFHDGWNAIYDGVIPGMETLLRSIRPHVRLIALTNTNAGHADVWKPRYAGLMDVFERIFCSHELGARKPEPASFQAVLDYLALPADRTGFFDDREDNVQAAWAMGMRGVVFRTVDDARRALRSWRVPGASEG